MNTQSNRYTFMFAVIVCMASAILLSAISEGLRAKQEANADLEVKKNILKSVQLRNPLSKKPSHDEILQVYAEKIEEKVVDDKGNIVADKKPSDIKGKEPLYPLYIYKEGQEVISYAFPVVGQGLWSTLYGYLAVEADATTVRGITFYKHGETPGLGGEIEKDWFQNNFKGKTIYSIAEKKVTPIIVSKGKAEDQYKDEALKYHVDGITAATLTGQGVTDLMARWVNVYEPYFSKLRKL